MTGLDGDASARVHELALTAHEAVSAVADRRELLAEPEVLDHAATVLSLWPNDAHWQGIGLTALDVPTLAAVALDAVLAQPRHRQEWVLRLRSPSVPATPRRASSVRHLGGAASRRC